MQSITMTSSFAGKAVGSASSKACVRARSAKAVITTTDVSVGDKAPDFTLPNTKGKNVTLSKITGGGFLGGGKKVVLYFYPADGSPGCTKEANAFKAAFPDFKAAGAEVLGVSSDSVEKHVEFKSELDLPFQLLADEGGSVRSEYGVPKTAFVLDGRQTFVIGTDGTVEMAFNSQFSPEKHVEEALAALA